MGFSLTDRESIVNGIEGWNRFRGEMKIELLTMSSKNADDQSEFIIYFIQRI